MRWELFFFFKVRAQTNKLNRDLSRLASKLKLKLSCPCSPRTPVLHRRAGDDDDSRHSRHPPRAHEVADRNATLRVGGVGMGM